MKIEHGILAQSASVVALGSFDGVHLGHNAVLSLAATHAAKIGVVSVAVCLMPPAHYELIEGEALQQRHIELSGIDICNRVEFEQYHDLSAHDFFHNVLVGTLGVKAIACGYDFKFGRGREGDVALLSELCEKNGVKLLVAEICCYKDERISSTRIRTALKEGDLEAANNMLTRPYTIDFEVKRGFGIGEKLGFPTANQYWESGYVVPKQGVYITQTIIDGRPYPSATGVTSRPSFTDDDAISCETTIADADLDLYGQKIEVQFYKYLLEPKKYNDKSELTKMVKDACRQSTQYFLDK